jgi:hypothetical protein
MNQKLTHLNINSLTDKDSEIGPLVTVKKINFELPFIGTSRFAKYSSWNSLVAGIAKHWCNGKFSCRVGITETRLRMLNFIKKQKR